MGRSEVKCRAQGARRAALLVGTFLLTGLSVSDFANATPIDPIRVQPDDNGVDLASGSVSVPLASISIGDPADGGMTFMRSLKFSSSADNFGTVAFIGTTGAAVFEEGQEKDFVPSSATPTTLWSQNGDGSTIVPNGDGTYNYILSDGTVELIAAITPGDPLLWVKKITKPNGEISNYHFKTQPGITNSPGYTWYPTRVQSITNTSGYQEKFTYQVDSATDAASGLSFSAMTSVTLINNAIDYCDPLADACTGLTQAWPKLTFSSVGSTTDASRSETITNLLNQTLQVNWNANYRLTGISHSPTTGTDVVFTWGTDNRLSSVAKGGLVSNYAWTAATTPGTATTASFSSLTAVRSDSLGTVRTTVANQDLGVIVSSTDALSRTMAFGYDSFGRQSSVILPEGNSVQYVYDPRGNVTQSTSVAKSGSGLADIVVSAGFDATCTILVKCNQPNWTKDALGNQTDYTYDTTTGRLLTVTQPAAVTGGIRPQIRFSYAPAYAWFKNSSGSFAQAPTAITKLTGTSACVTTASCGGTADERKTVIAYQAGSSSAASNLLPASVTSTSGDNALSQTSTSTYDGVGNVLTVDGPLAGSADTTAYRYDVLGRRVGTISADPDGAGALPNLAERVTFDAAGRAILAESGTTNGQTDAAWTGFTASAATATAYDANGRVSTQTAKSGSTTYSLTQNSYDARGRLDCTAVRMNTATFASLPGSACAAATAGSSGPDRISKMTYSAADEVISVQSALGTANAATESTAYNANGTTASVTDAANNRTAYVYDAFDRLSQTLYPVPTTGAATSSTTDYEQRTYDANGAVTSLRQRDASTIALTYDNLGRLTSRTPTGENTVSLSYDLLGNVLSVQRSVANLNVTYAYDALGRLKLETQPYGTAARQFDAAGNVAQMSWDDGFYVNYDHDILGRVTAIRENGATSGVGVLASYTYDSLGRRSSVAYGNGTSRTYAYDPLSRLSGLKIDLSGTANDQVIGAVGGTGTAIGYNPASQMAAIAHSNDAYAYGGRYNVSRNYITNGLNQHTTSGSLSLGYDARGNLTASGSTSFTYSKLNELTGAPGVAMVYDGTGRLLQYAAGGATRMTYWGSSLIAEKDSAGNVLRRYVPGPGTDEPVVWYEGPGTSGGTADRRFLQADERGSIVAVSDGAGSSIAINRYDEYGIPQSGNAGRFQYTGQTWYGELGMYNYKARIYSPTLGRFMQTDPIGYGDGLNWYAYVGGDPVNGRDPSGMAACPDPSDPSKTIICSIGGPTDKIGWGNSQGGIPWVGGWNNNFYNTDYDSRGPGLFAIVYKPPPQPQSGNGCKAPPNSKADRDAAARGDRRAYWNSRAAEGDPLAGTALGIVNNSGVMGQEANQFLQSAIVAHSPTMNWMGVANEMQSIGVDLMRAHVAAVDQFGSPNTTQITAYHVAVFNAHGLPGSTFGGTSILGSAGLTNFVTGWAGCRF